MKGLRRSAGLNLLNFGMSKRHTQAFMDLIQWFVTSLRANLDQVAHYTDNISGCGDSVISAISNEFFQIIKRIVLKIKISRRSNNLSQLVEALIWNYRGNDLNYLAEFNVIEVLQRGDGDRLHPIRLIWGTGGKIADSIANLFEFLFKQVLSQVILLDSEQDDSGNQDQ